MKSQNYKSGLFICIILVLLVVAGGIFSIFSVNDNSSTSSRISIGSKYIGVLDITGTIEYNNNTYNQLWLLEKIRDMKADKKNVGLILRIDSPGGTVYESDEAYLALQDYKTSGKPVYAYLQSMAASGGYYIACSANKIYANRNTLTGSIGVISGQSFDVTKLLENIGIKTETIHTGKNKNMGNYNEPLSAEQRKILQDIADESYEQFTAIVSNSRDMPISKVVSLADGRVYTAKQALNNGLIDNIDNFDNTIKDMIDFESFSKDVSVKYFSYEAKTTLLSSILTSFASVKESEAASKIGIPLNIYNKLTNHCNYPAFLYEEN